MKKAIRYLRFSQIGQSNGSIERQEMYTDQWIKSNDIELVDTFIDRGKSAKTFDRPDFIKLQEFISKHYKNVDYLLVDQLDRFSRNAGEAMSLVKTLQNKYGIQVVSVSEGIIFDYDTPGSFFRAGLQLLLAEEDNINRSIKIKGGLYTARAKEGRFVHNSPPFGYRKEGLGKQRKLVVNEKEAKIVNFIYDAYLRDVPATMIKQMAAKLGFSRLGNDAIHRVLTNSVYAGLLKVEAYKEHPGGLFPGIHEPIVDINVWKMVQSKMIKPDKVRTIIDDQMPLRGVLKCHCGNLLTGAPSRGKSGNYFYYYKCKCPKHNNISVVKSHEQFLKICELMSLSKRNVDQIREGCDRSVADELKNNKEKAELKRQELEDTEKKMFLLEEKWINSEINKDTYDRWYATYKFTIENNKESIKRLSGNSSEAFKILQKHLEVMTDVSNLYNSGDTLDKREFVKLVFDSNLYYEKGIYRTPTMHHVFAVNHLVMRKKGLLFYEKKRDNFSIIPSSGVAGNRTRVQTSN
ncbi:recombinase family protein [Flavobacterium sp. LAR06]|uniref:recombinase family protein n=1 Tax=Flavobacterium sp. LAR06 TaxID=3064897 RepID=UPI0035BEE8A4